MRQVEAALHYFVNLDAEIFRSGDFVGELRQHVQVLMIEAGEHFPSDKAVKIGEIADHPSSLVDRAADRDFDGVVVAVTVGIVALAVSRVVFFLRHRFAVKTVRGGEEIAAREVGFHIWLLASGFPSLLSVEINE
jgi:hypothetical protein